MLERERRVSLNETHPVLDVVDAELNIPSACCSHTWERDAEEGDGLSGPPTARQSHVPTILPLPWMEGSPPQHLFMPHPRLSFHF